MTPAIKVQVRNVYGQSKIYPACKNAELFSVLTGKKTFDHRDLQAIEALGYQIVQVNDVALAAIA